MDEDNTVPFKIFLFHNEFDEPEVRRFGLQPLCANNFLSLRERIIEVFPKLADKQFTITWKDEEGDEVSIFSDEELQTAIKTLPDLKKFNLRPQLPSYGGPGEKKGTYSHYGVYCDGCEANIVGYRYKCLVCTDYDLCSACEQVGIHPTHLMMRIPDRHSFDNVSFRKLIHYIKSFVSQLRHPEAEYVYGSKKRRKHEKRRSCPMGDVSPDSSHFKYLDWGLQALQKILDPLGATVVEMEVREEKEKKDKKEKKEKKDEKQDKEQANSAPSPPKRSSPTQQDMSESLKQKISEITKILASQTMSMEVEDDGWTAYEDLKKGFEEPRPSTSYEGTSKGSGTPPSAPQAETVDPKPNVYPNLQQYAKDELVKDALDKMLAMGFKNDGDWLKKLLEAKGGNIEKALESLCPDKSKI